VFFDTKEQPEFDTWLRLQCGTLYSQLQTLGQELSNQEFLLYQLQYEHEKTGDSPKVCYERVMDRKEHPEKYEDDDREEDAWHERDRRAKGFDPSDDGAEPGEDMDWDFDDPFGPSARQRDESDGGRPVVKSLFRELCRRLHPDVAGSMTRDQEETWHQVQAAYQSGDDVRLELLLSHCDGMEGRKPKQNTVWNIIALTRQIRHALRTLRYTIRRARHHPAWGFLSWDETTKDKCLKRARRELRVEIAELKDGLAYYNAVSRTV
jgi:hypothetical protein